MCFSLFFSVFIWVCPNNRVYPNMAMVMGKWSSKTLFFWGSPVLGKHGWEVLIFTGETPGGFQDEYTAKEAVKHDSTSWKGIYRCFFFVLRGDGCGVSKSTAHQLSEIPCNVSYQVGEIYHMKYLSLYPHRMICYCLILEELFSVFPHSEFICLIDVDCRSHEIYELSPFS